MRKRGPDPFAFTGIIVVYVVAPAIPAKSTKVNAFPSEELADDSIVFGRYHCSRPRGRKVALPSTTPHGLHRGPVLSGDAVSTVVENPRLFRTGYDGLQVCSNGLLLALRRSYHHRGAFPIPSQRIFQRGSRTENIS
jgi:hypothetical protein